jgi:hypothetical protein
MDDEVRSGARRRRPMGHFSAAHFDGNGIPRGFVIRENDYNLNLAVQITIGFSAMIAAVFVAAFKAEYVANER